MNSVTTQMSEPDLRISAAALGRVRELIHEEGNPALKLRVFIEGGGCSGFQYGFSFDEIRSEDDYVLAREGVELPVSYTHLTLPTTERV